MLSLFFDIHKTFSHNFTDLKVANKMRQNSLIKHVFQSNSKSTVHFKILL